MIVADRGESLEVCTQPDHARLAAHLLSLWRRDALPEHPRRAELLTAAREHDRGWQRTDAAPRVSQESGRPMSFDRTPAELRLEIWRRSVHSEPERTAFTELLIAQHALEVNRPYPDSPGWDEFAAELEEHVEELRDATGISPEELAADYRWLRLADALSLGACGGFASPSVSYDEATGYRFAFEPGRIRLDPLPFAGSTTLEVAVRELPRRRYADANDLAGELLGARWQRRPVRVELLAKA